MGGISSIRVVAVLGTCFRVVSAIHSQTDDEESTVQHPDSYDTYLVAFGHRNIDDPVPVAERRALFLERASKIEAHNLRTDVSWTETLNEFTDATPAELNAMLGYRRLTRSADAGLVEEDGNGTRGATSSEDSKTKLTSLYDAELPPADPASEVFAMDWRPQAPVSSKFIRQQGACGSCWAAASTGAVEMHAELSSGGNGSVRLSHIELVNCVKNPKHCGGTGGCKGATSELAYAYAHKHGMVAENDTAYHYQHSKECLNRTSPVVVQVGGYKTLPINKLEPMIHALQTVGPAVVSVSASTWSAYQGGVFAGCAMDAVINHAVLAVGYGHDKKTGMKFYLIRNSWGTKWGEAGYIRIERHSSDKGDAGYCGWDHKPKEGVFCDDAPAKVPICGMCGILSDTAYPLGVSIV